MSQKHHYEIGIADHGDVYDIVIRDNGSIIAVLSGGEGPAQHLVKAGNCFDELLEALKNLMDTWECNPDHYAEEIETYSPLLAKAEGR